MSKVPEQPARFFEDAKTCLAHLRGIPVVAIDALRENEASRATLVAIIHTCFDIFNEAGLNVADELRKQLVRDQAQDNLKEILSNDRPITLEELRAKGLKLHMTPNGPVVVPA